MNLTYVPKNTPNCISSFRLLPNSYGAPNLRSRRVFCSTACRAITKITIAWVSPTFSSLFCSSLFPPMADIPVTGLNTTQTINSPTGLTEEEATRYDRQMRLWGIEAQQRYDYRHSNLSTAWTSLSLRMRNATILVVRLRGVATEAIKNVVLAGIGKLIVMDDENVSEEDLGAGFFFRDGDVGSKVR